MSLIITLQILYIYLISRLSIRWFTVAERHSNEEDEGGVCAPIDQSSLGVAVIDGAGEAWRWLEQVITASRQWRRCDDAMCDACSVWVVLITDNSTETAVLLNILDSGCTAVSIIQSFYVDPVSMCALATVTSSVKPETRPLVPVKPTLLSRRASAFSIDAIMAGERRKSNHVTAVASSCRSVTSSAEKSTASRG